MAHRPGCQLGGETVPRTRRQFPDQVAGDRSRWRKRHPCLRRLELQRIYLVGVGRNGVRSDIETALPAECCIAGNDGIPDLKSGHPVPHHFACVRQRLRQFGTQSTQRRTKRLRRSGDIGIVVLDFGHSATMYSGSPNGKPRGDCAPFPAPSKPTWACPVSILTADTYMRRATTSREDQIWPR